MGKTSTIQGQDYKKALERLREDFKESELKRTEKGKHPYFPFSTYFNRLNEVIGVGNYNFSLDEYCFVTIGREYLSGRGTLSILDDDGNAVCRKTAGGGRNIVVVNGTGACQNMDNEMDSLTKAIFKNCMQFFGCGSTQLKKVKAEGEINKGVRGSQNGGGSATMEEKVYEVKILQSFSSLSKGYKTHALVNKQKQMDLILWNSNVQHIEKYMPLQEFLIGSVGKSLYIRGFIQPYKESSQIIMKGIAKEVA